jgi:hypothetical protein
VAGPACRRKTLINDKLQARATPAALNRQGRGFTCQWHAVRDNAFRANSLSEVTYQDVPRQEVQNPLYINAGNRYYAVRVNYRTESDPGGSAGYGHGKLTNGSDVTAQR